MVGKSLGHYEILEPLGAGGMGQVYRARDTKLERDVAIKVLPDELATDPERLGRLEREAKLLASVNHANIATIHGLEEAGGTRFLVLELIEGESLAQRLAAGPLPIPEVLRVCGQVAEALEAAHAAGIIHRDLKPANVLLTPAGRAKVLDFGLAKSVDADTPDVDPTLSPTATVADTRAGVILGTAPYMSPEQVRGQPLDERADAWAFGCVLFESLTSTRAFDGATLADVLAAVIDGEPDWAALPQATPPPIVSLIRKCLRRDPHRRLHSVADARIEIEDVLDEAGVRLSNERTVVAAASLGRTGRAGASRVALWRNMLPWGIAAVALAIALSAWIPLLSPSLETDLAAPKVFEVEIPTGVSFPACCGSQLDVSLDGRHVVFAAGEAGTSRLYVRRLDASGITPLAGTEGASNPSFSPAGDWIAYSTRTTIQKVAVGGGDPILVCTCPAETMTWIQPEWIHFSTGGSIEKISADGGGRQVVLNDPGIVGGRSGLPNGRGILVRPSAGGDFGVLSDSGEYKSIAEGSGPLYLPTGHVAYLRGSALFAARFDLEGLEIVGAPVRVLESVAIGVPNLPTFGFSQDGTIAFLPGGGTGAEKQLVWVDPNGDFEPAFAERRAFQNPSVSPDGRYVAVEIVRSDPSGLGIDIWILDLEQQTSTPLTTAGANIYPFWSPDQRGVTYSSNVGAVGGMDGFSLPADGSGSPAAILSHEDSVHPIAWTPDGGTLLYRRNEADGRNLYATTLEDNAITTPIAPSDFEEFALALSPNGEWIAYVSDRPGSLEVYVRAFPGTGPGTRVSRDGGAEPAWSRDGSRLFYRRGAQMMAVDIQTEPELRVGDREVLFEGSYASSNIRHASYDVGPDGRFLMIKEETAAVPARINVVVDWFPELERLLPADGSR